MSKFCIEHRVATLLAVIMVTAFGIIFATRLQMALMPDMEVPMAVVVCVYPGANPEDIEELVTSPLEAAIMSVSGVDEVTSTSSDSYCQIQVSYVEGTDLDIAATKLREQFDQLSLPEDAQKPTIMNMNISELMPTAMIALVGDDLAKLQILAEDVVAPGLERVDGVARVSVSGGVEQQINVEVDATRASGMGLSNSYISQMLAAQNLLFPGGSMENGSKTLTVSTDAKFRSVEDVANVLIPLPTGGNVRLSEVANVSMTDNDPAAIVRANGGSAVVLQVSKQSGANEVAVSEAVLDRLEKLQADHPGMIYTVPYVASEYIDLAVQSALQNILLGVLLAAVVVWIFLRNMGSTLTIALSMPVCILTVFLLMNVLDLTMNMMSLGGIAMGVGMIVDNSIVVLENITRFSAEGKDRMSACVEGTKEVTGSVVASTLTTMAVFVPLGLASGIAGQLFRDFCLTIASLIGASLVIAVTLVPLLCYFLLDEEKARARQMKKKQETEGFYQRAAGRLNGWYMKLLRYFVYHPKTGLLASVLLVVLFVVPLTWTRMSMIPDMDQGMVTLNVSMPTGSEVEETAAIADRLSSIVESNVPEIQEMFYLAQDESVTMMLDIGEKSQRERGSQQIVDSLKPLVRDIAGCEITVASSMMSTGMSSGGEIDVKIVGEDYNTLSVLAEDLAERIRALPDTEEVETSVAVQVPQVAVRLKREAAAQYGLTAASIGAAVRSELTGSTATVVTINNQDYNVVVKGDGTASESLDALRSMGVPSAFGGTVPLSSVAEVSVEQAPQNIRRFNQNRRVSVTGNVISGDTAAMTKTLNALLDNYPLPDGYTAQTSGAYEDMMDSFEDLLLALVVGLGLVYFVLAAQFESFLMPVIVMLILPVAFSGALFALPLTGRDLTMISLVAIIILAGTVVNSSIVLVEYIKIRREMGEDRQTAILHACPLRVRPILMTTLTTVLAMVPMAVGIGDTNEMMADMGVCMISGMVVSTAITLIFTPVYYSVIDDLSRVFGRKKKKQAAQG